MPDNEGRPSPEDPGWDKRWCGKELDPGIFCRQYRTFRIDGSRRDGCRHHGGNPRKRNIGSMTTGMSSYALREEVSAKLRHFSQDYQKLDLMDELAVFRAYIAKGLELWEGQGDLSLEEASWVFDKMERVGGIVEKIVRLRNETALTIAEVHFVQVSMATILKRFVPPEHLRSAVEELMRITASKSSETAPNEFVVDGVVVVKT